MTAREPWLLDGRTAVADRRDEAAAHEVAATIRASGSRAAVVGTGSFVPVDGGMTMS